MKAPERRDFEALLEIVAKLRDPQGGCPWDLEQTHDSLKPYAIEEAYEVVESIGDDAKFKEELGDLLLQVVLHAQIARERGAFAISDVVAAIADKLVSRHPHVFSDVKVHDSQEVLKNWEENKKKELKQRKKLLEGIPKGMPALLKAFRIGEKAAGIGFDWENLEGVGEKVLEELKEFIAARTEPAADRARLEEELGDLLFSLAQYARKAGFNPEESLYKACDKFSRRFTRLEDIAGDRRLSSMPLKELEDLWRRAKAVEE